MVGIKRDYTEITYDEYLELRDKSDKYFEFIDGVVMQCPSPSTKHQMASANLYYALRNFFKKSCVVLTAPFDVVLTKEGAQEKNVVIPDIAVMCDKSGFDEKKYTGVPTIIVEILSPSNSSHDTIVKLNLYAKYGIREYWIVNPTEKTITIYQLNENNLYVVYEAKESGKIKSSLFSDLEINLEEAFDYDELY